MTKFEEEFDKNVHVTSEMLTGRKICSANQAKSLGHGWVSPEEHQARVDELIEAKEKNIELLRKNSTLKSQLQQQALPVVPECVGEWIECVKGKNKNALALLDDDNMPDDVNEWLFFQRNDNNINLILRAWLDGYTVEKPQLFYLKHIDFCKTDKHYDWFTIKHSDGPLNHLRVEKGQKPSTIDCKFTQQEIDSMQTGSYEQIEVAE